MLNLTKRHYIFLGLLLTSWTLCQINLLQPVFQWIQDTLFNLFLIYFSWNVSYYVYEEWVSANTKKRVPTKGKAVLITGCDSGFGFLLAKSLVQQGYNIFACCLSLSSDGAQKLNNFKDRISIIQLDVTDPESIRKARLEVELKLSQSPNLSLWALVNNAGVMCLGEIEFGNTESWERQWKINTLGVVRVTKTFLKLLKNNNLGSARVINVASLAGRFTMPCFVGYCMSKAAVIVFNDGLRREIAKWNIEVVSIEPHLYKTNLVDQQRLISELETLWTQTDQDIRDDYGRPYYDGLLKTMKTSLNTARDDINHVVQTMIDAISLEQVEWHYIVAKPLERLRIWFWYNVASEWLIDFCMRKLLTDCNGIPKKLLMIRNNLKL